MMSPHDSPLAMEEYRALRATIRERGSLRIIVIALTFLSWAAVVSWTFGAPAGQFLGLVSLVMLVAGFELVFALHTSVERIGRYVQARYESGGSTLPGWEHAAMSLGAAPVRLGIDPLASGLFLLATILNMAAAMSGVTDVADLTMDSGSIVHAVAILVAHVVFVWRVLLKRRVADQQRPLDLDFFRGKDGA